MYQVMSCYPEAILRLHVERRLEEMIPTQIVCIALISPVLRNWLDSHTLDLFTTNVFAWRRCSLVKSSLWFDWFNGFQCRTFSRCTVGQNTVGCGEKTAKRRIVKVKLTFIGHSGSMRSVFYLYRAADVCLSNNPLCCPYTNM